MADDLLNPAQRLNGRQVLGDALKTFLYSLSQGVAAQSQAPGRMGSRMGVAAALGAPMQLQEMERQRQMQDEERRFKIEQIREATRRGQLQDAVQLLNSLRDTTAPEVTVNAPVATPARIGGLNGGPGFQPPAQGGGTQQIPMPLKPVDIPGYGPVSPKSSQQMAQEALQQVYGEEQAKAMFAPPPEPRNIDPLSPEGIAASVQRERQISATKPSSLIPGRDIPYPPEVEEQRKRMNANRAEQGGLSPQQFTQANVLARQFDGAPIVKEFNESVKKVQQVADLVARPMGGPGDLATVYAFMKALDPTSVVRETEFASAANSGNIFAGAYARFNGYLNPNGGFLPENVKASFAEILKRKLQTDAKQLRGLYDDYARRIDVITRQPGSGSQWLTDYSMLFEDAGGASANPYR